MRVFFLAAGSPLTKTFSRQPDGSIEKSAYPLVKNFTSTEMEVATPDDFFLAIRDKAAQGQCLLKGLLSRPLTNESRAGTTSSLDPTVWSCFDLDGLPGIATPEDFVQNVLPVEFHGADYIMQWSASSGITSSDLRCHLFFMHSTPFSPEIAKLWLTDLNLSAELLSPHTELTASSMALRYPLDRTVMQNDKLIYIAPPVLGEGIADPIAGNRIQLIRKGKPFVDYAFPLSRTAAAIDTATYDRVEELRVAQGLRRKKAKYKVLESGERLLLNPDATRVTGEKRDRDFVRVNLNGGDSWAYYYWLDNPRYLHNFKGEPIVELCEIAPAYWEELQPKLAQERTGIRPFAFRHLPTDTIYNGMYDHDNDRILDIAATAGGKKLVDFFMQYGMEQDNNLDWTYEFQPHNETLIDFDARFCNKWQRTEWQRMTHHRGSIPPTINKLLWSILGGDEVCYHHFLNWLAAIWQTREKLGTAWILHGVQGTGKGVFFHHVLVPLFGERYCVTKQLRDFDDKFNADMETCLLFNIDEVKLSSQTNSSRTLNQIKALITEPVINMRAMRQNAVQVKNYTNFILTSNDYDAMAIDEFDRRFNVAPRQENRIAISAEEIAALAGELSQFVGYLNAYVVDMAKARTALDNAAKHKMRLYSMDSIEQYAYSIHSGNLDFLMQFVEGHTPEIGDFLDYEAFATVVRRCVEHAGQPMVLTSGEMEIMYKYLTGVTKYKGQLTFTKMMQHKNIDVSQVHHVDGERERGVSVVWKASDLDLAHWRAMFAKVAARKTSDPMLRVVN